jgi:HSP20 family molecular chaperone IbpA
MSAKWRRSKKHLKWLDLKTIKINPRKTTKTPKIENFKTSRGKYPQKYRIPKRLGKGKWKAPQPLIDMFQDQNYVTITAQIAGINQENLKINIKNQKLTLTAKTKEHHYYKSINLPKTVIPTIAHTTYKNGVLEIKLKKPVKTETTIKQQQAGINDAT